MKIKQGDKVRVSKDAPRMYMSEDSILPLLECEVLEVETDNARIEPKDPDGYFFKPLIIPCKYLVKVDAEEKEAKFKVGDRVKDRASHKIGTVLIIEGNSMIVGIPYDKWKHVWNIDSVELVKPTEQTEAEKPNIGSIKIPVEVDLTDGYWQAYAADLAKEIVVKIASRDMNNDPDDIAEHAVLIAKAVVEGLKRK